LRSIHVITGVEMKIRPEFVFAILGLAVMVYLLLVIFR
jgi:hypothetical protein